MNKQSAVKKLSSSSAKKNSGANANAKKNSGANASAKKNSSANANAKRNAAANQNDPFGGLAQGLFQLGQSMGQAFQAMAGAAGWHGADDIQTMKGLAGEYLWAENAFNPGKITFTFDAGAVGYKGKYKIVNLLGMEIEKGVFNTVPNNPAIGWASITLQPAGGANIRSFVVSGMMTGSDWKIVIMLLNKLDASGPVLPAFSAVRIGV